MMPAPMPVATFTNSRSRASGRTRDHSPQAMRFTSLSTWTGTGSSWAMRAFTSSPNQPCMPMGFSARPLAESTGLGSPMPTAAMSLRARPTLSISSLPFEVTWAMPSSRPRSRSRCSRSTARTSTVCWLSATAAWVCPRSATSTRRAAASSRKLVEGRPPVRRASPEVTSPREESSSSRDSTVLRAHPVASAMSARLRGRASRSRVSSWAPPCVATSDGGGSATIRPVNHIDPLVLDLLPPSRQNCVPWTTNGSRQHSTAPSRDRPDHSADRHPEPPAQGSGPPVDPPPTHREAPLHDREHHDLRGRPDHLLPPAFLGGVQTHDEVVEIGRADPAAMWDRILGGLVEAGITDLEMTFPPADWRSALEAFGSAKEFRRELERRGLRLKSGFHIALDWGPDTDRAEAADAAAAYADFLREAGGDTMVVGPPMRRSRDARPPFFVDHAYMVELADILHHVGAATLDL